MSLAGVFMGLFQGLIFVLVGIFFIWVAKTVDDWRTRDFDDDVHIDNGNLAVGLRRGGLYLGVALGLSGALSGGSSGFFLDLIHLIIDGLIIIGLLFASRFLNDSIMLGHVDNDAECIKEFTRKDGQKVIGNTAVGLVEASMYLATGFILKGSLSGGGGTFLQSIGSAILFFVLGQMALLLFGLLYELITPFNVRGEIQRNNPAAGVGLGGILVSLGIILMSSISGPFTGWANDLIGFLIYTAYGIVMLLVFRSVIDRLLLPTTSISVEIEEDQNVAATVLAESAIAAVALIIAFSM